MSMHHVERAALTDMMPSRKLVFMAICDAADKDTGLGFPGFDTMQKWSGLGKSQVHDNVAALIADGWIARVSSGRKGKRAVFRVFDQTACCALHTPLGVESGTPDPEQLIGSGIGSGTSPAKGPVATGPLPSTQASKQTPPTPSPLMERFDDFWEIYGKKVGKGQAERAWRAARKKADAVTIIDGAAAFIAWTTKSGTDPQFIPHPATWLNGERWTDERPTEQTGTKLTNVRDLQSPPDGLDDDQLTAWYAGRRHA